MTVVKLRGTSDNMPGDEVGESIRKFWRGLFSGVSALRFHRPPSLGLSEPAQASIRAIRRMERHVRFWEMEPRPDLLRDRAPDSFYLMARPGAAYALYATDGGAVRLDLRDANGPFRLRWIEIRSAQWREEEIVTGGSVVPIDAPGRGAWGAVLTPAEDHVS